MGFPNETTDASSVTNPIYWALFIQYPVLSFLDSKRKELLLDVVASLVRSGALPGTPLGSFNVSAFCIGKVVHYQVSSYQESVLINFYFNDVVNTPYVTTGISITEFDDAFMRGYNVSIIAKDQRVQDFRGRSALVIDNTTLNDLIGGNYHPGGQGLEAAMDPTLRAIFLGSYVGNTTIDTARSEQDQDFASNPRPINFGLEAGDIIFAIFGGLFLTVMMGLVLLGFCIHPFFLA